MYEDADFLTEKLTACIYAALRWPVGNPPSDNASLATAWHENQGIVSSIIHMSLYKYEQAVVEPGRIDAMELLYMNKIKQVYHGEHGLRTIPCGMAGEDQGSRRPATR
jgi:hypothetical protein